MRSGTQYSEVLTQRQMAALESCLHAAHRLIETYLSFSTEVMNGLPTIFYFVRCFYAMIVLIKMHMAVTSPGSEVGKIIKPDDIRVIELLEGLWNKFMDMVKRDMLRPECKVFKIMGVLRDWFLMHKDGETNMKKEVSKAPPHGKHLHGNKGDSRLQVLSEAATAGSHSMSDNGSRTVNTDWTFDSPAYPSQRIRPMQQSNGESSGPSPGTRSSSTNTPRQSSMASNTTPTYSGYVMPGANTQQDKSHLANSNTYNTDPYISFDSASCTDNLDWTADMNLEQVLDGAFRDFDMSGDLGGWFLGDGVDAYQIPDQGSALQSGANDGGQDRW